MFAVGGQSRSTQFIFIYIEPNHNNSHLNAIFLHFSAFVVFCVFEAGGTVALWLALLPHSKNGPEFNSGGVFLYEVSPCVCVGSSTVQRHAVCKDKLID